MIRNSVFFLSEGNPFDNDYICECLGLKVETITYWSFLVDVDSSPLVVTIIVRLINFTLHFLFYFLTEVSVFPQYLLFIYLLVDEYHVFAFH